MEDKLSLLPGFENAAMPREVEMVGSRVLVKRLEARGRTRSGLVLPGNMKPEATEGEVVKLGPGILLNDGRRVPLQSRVGDHVLIGPRVVELRIDDEPYYVVDEGDILAILRS